MGLMRFNFPPILREHVARVTYQRFASCVSENSSNEIESFVQIGRSRSPTVSGQIQTVRAGIYNLQWRQVRYLFRSRACALARSVRCRVCVESFFASFRLFLVCDLLCVCFALLVFLYALVSIYSVRCLCYRSVCVCFGEVLCLFRVFRSEFVSASVSIRFCVCFDCFALSLSLLPLRIVFCVCEVQQLVQGFRLGF